MKPNAFGRPWIYALTALSVLSSASAIGAEIEGQVLGAGAPIARSAVTLWSAGAGAPRQLGQAPTGDDGRFTLSYQSPSGPEGISYLVAKGGEPTVRKGGGNPGIAFLAVLGGTPPAKVVINELTTVASAFAAAQFIKGESISGNPLGLRIAAGNTPNLVDPVTGGWGKVLLDPLNSTQTATLANLNTLGSLISAFATVANDDWRARFLKSATPPSGADAEEYAGSDGRHCPRAVGQCERTLRPVRRGLPAAQGRVPARGTVRSVSRLHSA